MPTSVQVSPLPLLGIAFIVLKLCGVIGWSWWYVTMPFWGPLALVLGLLAIGVVLYIPVALLAALVKR